LEEVKSGNKKGKSLVGVGVESSPSSADRGTTPVRTGGIVGAQFIGHLSARSFDRLRMVSLSFDSAQDSELVELSNHKSSNYILGRVPKTIRRS
jgi:hypothetical protein